LRLFRGTSFGLFLLSRLCAVSASQMVSVAVAWQVYERTGDALALGFTGLAQFATMALLAPITGEAADRFAQVVQATLISQFAPSRPPELQRLDHLLSEIELRRELERILGVRQALLVAVAGEQLAGPS